MNSTMVLSFASLAYILLLAVMFFSKKKIKSEELEVFKKIIITTIACLVMEILLTVLIVTNGIGLNILLHVFNVCIFTWLWFFGLYAYLIFRKNKLKNFKSNIFYRLYQLFYVVTVIILLYLPLSLYSETYKQHSYGPSVNFLFFIIGIMIVTMLVVLIINYKSLTKKKYYPVVFLVMLMFANAIIQNIWPHILLANSIFSIITFIIYFTIENPDVKVINELNKNKDILEKNNEDRSNFMFRMTQEVRKPLSNIDSLTNMIDIKNKYVTLEDIVNAIKANTRHISYVVNNVLDVSNIDVRKIKIVNTTYDVKRLFEEINILIKDKIGDDVTYHSHISNEMPMMLYGDYIKLKQIIMSILMNSVENTKQGFIELNINVLIKYDMCRLIISVEDSGKGMDIKQVNDILTIDKPIDEEEEKKLDCIDTDLNITKKIINLIGGSMMIRSDVDKGTEFIVVVDQKIAESKENKKQLKNINNEIKRVLVVDDNLDTLQMEKKLLENYQIDVVSTMYGMDAVDRVRTGEYYDLILIDDDMDKQSGVATLEALNKLDNFNIPIVVMLEENKEVIKKHYLEKGFVDYLLKSNLDKEIKRIVNTRLK